MDWTEAEARLATLEREVTRHQWLARENQAVARDDDRVAAVGRGPRRGRWLGIGHWRWRWLPGQAAPAPALGARRTPAPLVA